MFQNVGNLSIDVNESIYYKLHDAYPGILSWLFAAGEIRMTFKDLSKCLSAIWNFYGVVKVLKIRIMKVNNKTMFVV